MLITNGKVCRNIAAHQFQKYAAMGYKEVKVEAKTSKPKPKKPKE